MTEQLFWKAARPDGWDFYTGSAINYRDNIGKLVHPPGPTGPAKLCSARVLHASIEPDGVFQGARLPLSLYRVAGAPAVRDGAKAGFTQMRVIGEVDPARVFRWRYGLAVNPVHPLNVARGPVTDLDLARLTAWARTRDNTRASVAASVWAMAWDSVSASIWATIWDRAWDSVSDNAKAKVSIWASVGAYTSHIFQPAVPAWADTYPYQPALDLWNSGLVPSYDGEKWRLHAGKKAAVVWEGSFKQPRLPAAKGGPK